MKIFNQHNKEALIEIVKSKAVSYTGGEADFSLENVNGVKIKASSTGVVEAQLAGNDSGDWELINIDISNQYSDERVLKVRESGTTIPVADLRIGY